MEPMLIFIVEPRQLVREGLRQLLEQPSEDPRFVVCGEAGTLAQALDRIELKTAPGILLLDYPAEEKRRVQEIRAVREALPKTRIVILAALLSGSDLSASFEAGADGCLLKDISSVALKQSLRLVGVGEKVFPSTLASMIVQNRLEARPRPANDAGTVVLSNRETEILKCVVGGHANKLIGYHLGIAESTVKVHLKAILRKIRATNRTQAAIWAFNHGLDATKLGRSGQSPNSGG